MLGGDILDTKQARTTGTYATYSLRSDEYRHHTDSAMIALEHVLRRKERRFGMYARFAFWGVWLMCILTAVVWFFSRFVSFVFGGAAVFHVFFYVWISHVHRTYKMRLQAVLAELRNRSVISPDP